MRKTHASGHISQPEIREMVEEINPEKLFAIYTEDSERFKVFALDVPEIATDKLYEV